MYVKSHVNYERHPPLYPVFQKPGPLQYPGTTSLKRTRGYPRFLAEMIVIHSPGWEVWYGSRTTHLRGFCKHYCRIAGRLHGRARFQQWNSCIRKHLGLFHRNYGCRLAYQIWGWCMQERVYTRSQWAQLKQRPTEVWVDF